MGMTRTIRLFPGAGIDCLNNSIFVDPAPFNMRSQIALFVKPP
jgi:hypothetical protein